MKTYNIILLLFILLANIGFAGTVSIQYSAQKVQDAYILNSHPTFNSYQSESSAITYYSSNNTINRSFIKIPIPNYITQNIASSITNAELKLFFRYHHYEPFSINIHGVQTEWDEKSLIWSNQPLFNSNPEDTTIIESDYTWYTFTITDLVKNWIFEELPNYGVMLRATIEEKPTQKTAAFSTSNHDNPYIRPVLQITSPELKDTLITDVNSSQPSSEYSVDKSTISLLHFNDNSGKIAVDASSNHANATLYNGATWTSGKFNSGILLDGIDDYLSFSNDSLFDFGENDDFSIEFWIKLLSNNQTGNKFIFSNQADADSGIGYSIWIDNYNFLHARLSDNTLIGQHVIGSELFLNKWYNIVFIRGPSSSRLEFYVDGVLVGNESTVTRSLKNSYPFYIGRKGEDRNWNSSCINAIIDEVRISKTIIITSICDKTNPIKAEQYVLRQNFPNPFNPQTCISFSIPKTSEVTISIFDVNGRQINNLAHQIYNAGQYNIFWNAEFLSSGTYFIKFNADDYQEIRKCLFLK